MLINGSALLAVRAVRSALFNNSAATSNSGNKLAINHHHHHHQQQQHNYATKSSTISQKKSTITATTAAASTPPAKPKDTASSLANKNVDPPSLIFKKVEGVIGPNASKQGEYKNPEYFCYHELSFCDMEEVMAKFRLPQPSSLK